MDKNYMHQIPWEWPTQPCTIENEPSGRLRFCSGIKVNEGKVVEGPERGISQQQNRTWVAIDRDRGRERGYAGC